jgi:hypothetical protein
MRADDPIDAKQIIDNSVAAVPLRRRSGKMLVRDQDLGLKKIGLKMNNQGK